MYPSTEIYMKQIAAKYNCIRGKEAKIGELLEQIERGKLEVKESVYVREDLVDRFSIGLEILVPKTLKGTMAVISERIAKEKGNIFRVKTRQNGTKGIIQFFLVLHRECNTKNLIDSLEQIKVKEIEQFYEESEFNLAIASLIHDKIDDQSFSQKVQEFKYKSLISDITCAIGYELTIKNEVGVLAKVSRKITEAKLLISSVDECVGNNPEHAIMKLFVHIQATFQKKIYSRLIKIDDIFEELEKMPEIITVKRLGVNSFD